MAQLTATVLMTSGPPFSVTYEGDGKNGDIHDRKNIINAIHAKIKAGVIDPNKLSGFTSSEGSFTLSGAELASLVKAKPSDPAASGAAKTIGGKIKFKLNGKEVEIGSYKSKSAGTIDKADETTARKLVQAEIARRLKLKAGDADKLDEAPKTVDIKIEEDDPDGTGPQTAKTKEVKGVLGTAPKAPPKSPPDAPPSSPPADSTKTAGADTGEAKPGYVEVPVSIKGKGGKGTETVKVNYQSDGESGISEEDAKNFISMYEDAVDSDRRDRAATVKIEGEDATISKLYAMSKQPIKKEDEAPTADKSGDVPLDSASSYIASPTRVNRAHLDAERADMDALIAMLLNAIAGGNLDVITSIFDALAQKSGLTVAEVAAKTAEALGMSDKEAAEFGEKMAAVSKDSSDPKKRAEANAEIQKLQLLLQQNQNRRDQLMQNLRTLLSLNDTMKNGSDSLHGWKDKEANHYRWT